MNLLLLRDRDSSLSQHILQTVNPLSLQTGAVLLPAVAHTDLAAESVPSMSGVLRLAQEKARQQRAEKRAAKKEEKRLMAEQLKAEVCMLLVLPPFHTHTLYVQIKGNELFKQQRYEEAVTAFENACETAGQHPVYLSNAAAAYLKLDE